MTQQRYFFVFFPNHSTIETLDRMTSMVLIDDSPRNHICSEWSCTTYEILKTDRHIAGHHENVDIERLEIDKDGERLRGSTILQYQNTLQFV